MSLFLTKEGKRKSPMAVTCFFVDLLFCLVFGGAYALLTEPLHNLLPLGGGMPETVLHCLIIAVIGTAAADSHRQSRSMDDLLQAAQQRRPAPLMVRGEFND